MKETQSAKNEDTQRQYKQIIERPKAVGGWTRCLSARKLSQWTTLLSCKDGSEVWLGAQPQSMKDPTKIDSQLLLVLMMILKAVLSLSSESERFTPLPETWCPIRVKLGADILSITLASRVPKVMFILTELTHWNTSLTSSPTTISSEDWIQYVSDFDDHDSLRLY